MVFAYICGLFFCFIISKFNFCLNDKFMLNLPTKFMDILKICTTKELSIKVKIKLHQ